MLEYLWRGAIDGGGKMRDRTAILLAAIMFIAMPALAGDMEPKPEDIFDNSLHKTAKGMEFWYSKENSGFEQVTGVPYGELSCSSCHVKSCDVCHAAEKGGKRVYSESAAKNQGLCLKCHVKHAAIYKIDSENHEENPHNAKGMICTDCHSARDMHGDGIQYDSMKQPGAIAAKCETCHSNIEKSVSHTIHGDKLDCTACHVRQVVSCANCHMGTLKKEHKKVYLPFSGWTFLLNYRGKVASANMQTFVAENKKGFLIFAPQYSHSLREKGRLCNECHGIEVLKKMDEGKLELLKIDKGELVQAEKGVIPVAEEVKYGCALMDRVNDAWVPIEGEDALESHFPAFGSPLSKEQIADLKEKR